MFRSVQFLCVLLVLGACSPRATILEPVPDAPQAHIETIFVATTRVFDGRDDTLGRSETPSFARYQINVPPNRSPGEIPYPGRSEAPNTDDHFLVADARTDLTTSEFRSAIRSNLRTDNLLTDDIILYVHGYNNTFADGLFRIAQMRRDLKIPGTPVHYAWPSAGHPLGYAYDRDSALFARDGLERLITQLSRTTSGEIILVAHSLGSLVTMEALRQLNIANDRNVLNKVGGVILLSPDLDVDVFRAQAARIKPMPDPFVIFTSQRDRALALSARITGQTARLGNLGEIDDVSDLDVTLVDLSNVEIGSGDAFNHFTAATSPAVIQILQQLGQVSASFESSPSNAIGLLPGTVLTLQNATQVVLTPGTP